MKSNIVYPAQINKQVVLITILTGLVFAPVLYAQDAATGASSSEALMPAVATTSVTDTSPAAPASPAPVPTTTPATTSTVSTAKPAQANPDKLGDAYRLFVKGDLDNALDKVDAIIKQDPQNVHAYLMRASIYAQEKQWDKAADDYEAMHRIDPNNAVVKFNQAELKFMQKKYDDARPGFVELQSDKSLGDFATYKVFLCDLFGSHEDAASKELDALNQGFGNPSYYFGNAAWDLVHKKNDDASNWLNSAGRIYANAPEKIANYTASLESLGYLPLHPTSTQ